MTLLELHDFVRPLASAEFYRIFAAKGFDAADVARCPRESSQENWQAAKTLAWKAADRVSEDAFKAAGFPVLNTTLCHQSGGERSDRPF
jgi:hypothetical protein